MGVKQHSLMSLPLNEKVSRYSAPEVVVSTTFQPTMDVFSFGQVLSDLWYGFIQQNGNSKTASGETTDETTVSETAPCSVGGLRIPTVREHSDDVSSKQRSQPPQRYNELIVSCTDPLPANRPKVERVKNLIFDIASSLEDGDSVELSN